MLAFGLLNCGVLNALKASARNSTRRASVIGKLLKSERSTCRVPGTCKMLRPELPQMYWPGARSAGAPDQGSMVRCESGSSPEAMRFGNCEPVPVFRLFVCMVEVNGKPVWNVPMELICHPPAIHCTGCAAALIHRRPL